MNEPGVASSRGERGLGLPDTLVVLAISCTLVLFLLWVAGHALGRAGLFEQFPPWLKELISDWKAFATGAGASAVAAVLKYFVDRDAEHPNYALWIGGTSVALLLMLVGTTVFLRVVTPPVPLADVRPLEAKLLIRFSPELGSPPRFLVNQTDPVSYENPRLLSFQPQRWYKDLVRLPEPGKMYRAILDEADAEGRLVKVAPGTGGPGNSTRLCFVGKRADSTARPASSPPLVPDISLTCSLGQRCTPDREDAWAAPCAEPAGGLLSPAPAFAQAAPSSGPAWRVPSLQMLEATQGTRQGTGYTRFTIEAEPTPALQKASHYTYAIRVNGAPVLINGWAPETVRVGVDAAKGFSLVFGLENLNFRGAKAGIDELAVTLDFNHGQDRIMSVNLTLPYVALRSSPEQRVEVDGRVFRWSAEYVRSVRENKYEVFFFHSRDPRAAELHREAADGARLVLADRPVLGVIRPPLGKKKNPHYGLVLGVVQDTGQVRFTFDDVSARQLCRLALDLPRTVRSAALADIYRYDVDGETALPCSSVVR